MSNARKLFQKMCNTYLNWRIEQLETVARHYNVRIRRPGSGSSHVIFHHPNWIESLSVPAHRPVKPVYVKNFVALISTLENLNE